MTFQPNTDELLGRNAEYAAAAYDSEVPGQPARHLAIVACMDSRINPYATLGLADGDAHMIRNAGGVITDDVIRSLCLSQRYLGTKEIILIHHTDCGLQSVDEAQFREELTAELGVTPAWSLDGFSDPYDNVRQSIKRLTTSPFLPHTDHIRGFVYDVTTGLLNEVSTTDEGNMVDGFNAARTPDSPPSGGANATGSH